MWNAKLLKHATGPFQRLANLHPIQADPGNLSYKAAAVKSSLLWPILRHRVIFFLFWSRKNSIFFNDYCFMEAQSRRAIKHWNLWASSSFHFSQINYSFITRSYLLFPRHNQKWFQAVKHFFFNSLSIFSHPLALTLLEPLWAALTGRKTTLEILFNSLWLLEYIKKMQPSCHRITTQMDGKRRQ